jgi:hypothetical protein
MKQKSKTSNQEIAKIYPIKWVLFLRNYFLFLILLYFLIVISGISGIYRYYHILFARIIFYCGIVFITLYLLYSFIDLFKVPILLNENSITPYENKLKVKILGKRKIINFKDIQKINNIEKEKEWWKFTIFLKNGSKIHLYVDESEDINLVLDAFNKYKSQNPPTS